MYSHVPGDPNDRKLVDRQKELVVLLPLDPLTLLQELRLTSPLMGGTWRPEVSV